MMIFITIYALIVGIAITFWVAKNSTVVAIFVGAGFLALVLFSARMTYVIHEGEEACAAACAKRGEASDEDRMLSWPSGSVTCQCVPTGDCVDEVEIEVD